MCPIATASSSTKTIPVASLRVLVVEDSDLARIRAVEAVRSLGVTEVAAVEDGIRALQWLANPDKKADLVLVDLHMPRMDGIELLRHLAVRKIKTSVVILSAAQERVVATADRLSRAHGLNLLGVLTKPIEVATLRTFLESVPQIPATAIPAAASKPILSPMALRNAIVGHQLYLLYQPKISVKNGQLRSVEALVRWRHPEHGELAPNDFISLAERSGLIDDLTLEVFAVAMAQLETWRDQSFMVSMAINLSPDSFSRAAFPEELEKIARFHGVSPNDVILEVNESRLVRDDRLALTVLQRLHAIGFRLAIDDFGTGFATTAQLSQLPAQELKLDGAFVRGAADNPRSQAMQVSSHELSRRFGLSVVAEGIESQADWDEVARNHYDFGQGYFIAQPMRGDDVMIWERERHGRSQPRRAS